MSASIISVSFGSTPSKFKLKCDHSIQQFVSVHSTVCMCIILVCYVYEYTINTSIRNIGRYTSITYESNEYNESVLYIRILYRSATVYTVRRHEDTKTYKTRRHEDYVLD